MKKHAFFFTFLCLAMMMVGILLYMVFNNVENSGNETDAKKYYTANSDIIDIIDVTKSKEVLTETEATTLFKERGFIDQPMISSYTIEGEFIDEYEISDDSNEKHPMYETYYLSKTGEVWTILVVNGMIVAYPVNYNLESDLSGELFISESEKITSYDEEDNKFYVTVPYETASIVKIVSRIDTETLDGLSKEVIDTL